MVLSSTNHLLLIPSMPLPLSAKAITALFLAAVLTACASSAGPEPETTSTAFSPTEQTRYTTWETYGGDKAGTRFSLLDQINRKNVDQLEVAWVHHTGDKRPDSRGTMEVNPIVVDGIMYLTTPALKVVALNAATGEQLWSFDPYAGKGKARGVNRGVTYWEDGDDKRILFTAGWTSKLYALDADTGQPVTSFGNNGTVDIGKGIQRPHSGPVTATTPGTIYKDLLILGTRVGEGPKPAAPGDVCAYDVRTGERRWCFHTIPHPKEFGHKTWAKDSWKRAGGANAWGGVSVDSKRGLVFLPLGSPTYIFYGGQRKGENLFANSVVALDATTGKRVWHYQLVHHDLWDYEPTAVPNLVTVTHEGQRIDAVAQVSKRGDIFLLNRETGEPLFPVEERPVPQSTLPGEHTAPTQPFPVKPPAYVRQGFTKEMLADRSPEVHEWALNKFKQLRSEGMFTPPSREGSIVMPGFRGGTVWGGASFDPTTGYLYVNASEVPGILKMVRTDPPKTADKQLPAQMLYQTNCASCHGLDRSGNPPDYPSLKNIAAQLSKSEVRGIINNGRGMMPPFKNNLSEQQKDALVAFLFNEKKTEFVEGNEEINVPAQSTYPYLHDGWKTFKAPDGYPAVKPPWGTLSAIDLNKGKIAWQVPLGEYPELTEKGIPPTGTDNLGGSVVTAGGLVFIGASKDEMFRAFDKRTGEILWETKLPAGGYATPSVYEVDGKQYVVIPAGGGGLLRTKASDAIVAFGLPD